MSFKKIPCDDRAQDKFAKLYIRLAMALDEEFDLNGCIVVRNAVKLYGKTLGGLRRNQLVAEDRKVNLKTMTKGGSPLPCGLRTDKEWLRVETQEMWVNVSTCPLAEVWKSEDACKLGEMYCEEFYNAYYKEAATDKCQVNLGQRITYWGENIYHRCRLSVYLRPANLNAEQRKAAFEEWDTSYKSKKEAVPEKYDYDAMTKLMYACMMRCAQEELGQECVEKMKKASLDCAKSVQDNSLVGFICDMTEESLRDFVVTFDM